jgi:hypothetical protein
LKLAIANSGSVTLDRPDKLHATRKGGFSDAELFYDGKAVTLLRKDENIVAQAQVTGDIDHLIDELRNRFQKVLPGADLLSDNIYEGLMPPVKEAKDLGSGVIRGVECDHLAFRADDYDWQIWIAQGDRPYPMRYVITSRDVPGSPQYQVDITNFKAGTQVADVDFSPKLPASTKKSELSDIKGVDELPEHFTSEVTREKKQ